MAACLRPAWTNGQLRIASLLGSTATCTNPATCMTALNTPIRSDVSCHYSIGHWVEDDRVSGDGAFSSAGVFGVYPWISADTSLYGVLARVDAAGGGNPSALCGASTRKAWVTGVAQ